jgi:pimeloyl-ACP methyl ester carboxylesterase
MNKDDLAKMNKAIEAAQTGQRDAAHADLLALHATNPEDPNLALWLAYTAPGKADAAKYLARAEELNPQNPSLAGAKNWLASRFPPSPTPDAITTGASKSQPEPISNAVKTSAQNPPAAKNGSSPTPSPQLPTPSPKKPRNPLIYISIGVLLLAALIVGWFGVGRYLEQQEYQTEVDFYNWGRSGVGNFLYEDVNFPERPLLVWFYRPAGISADAPLIFAIHGSERNGSWVRDRWMQTARQYKAIVIAPEFSSAFYDDIAFSLGGTVDADYRVQPPEKWTFTLLESLFGYIQGAGYRGEKFYLYGHSAGAQFVHRYVLHRPDSQLAKAVAANSGYYSLPDFAEKFPYGLGGSAVSETTLKTAFSKEFGVFLGANDTDPTDFDGIEAIRQQGFNRLERGRTFYAAAKRSAQNLNTPLNWKLLTVQDEGHTDLKIIPLTAEYFFGKK